MATLGSRHGIALVGCLPVRGVLGWLVARGYHVLQLPFTARRIRVLADWSAPPSTGATSPSCRP